MPSLCETPPHQEKVRGRGTGPLIRSALELSDICLGTDPYYKRTPFTEHQVVHFLEKVQTMGDKLKVGKIEASSVKLGKRRKPNELAIDVTDIAKISS